jgi:hypothetical protein
MRQRRDARSVMTSGNPDVDGTSDHWSRNGVRARRTRLG